MKRDKRGRLRYTEEEKEKISLRAKRLGYGKWMFGYKRPENWINPCIGRKHSEEWKKKIGESGKGQKRSLETRRKIAESKRGSKSHFWKGGRIKEIEKLRKSVEWRIWREKVFKRDNWICQKCGQAGDKLHPHHIKDKSLFPELIFVVENGETLCHFCHKDTDSYGKHTVT